MTIQEAWKLIETYAVVGIDETPHGSIERASAANDTFEEARGIIRGFIESESEADPELPELPELPKQCIIRIKNREITLPYREIETLKRKAHREAQSMMLQSDSHWKASNENSHYRREYYDTANNPVIVTIAYL